MGFIIQIVALLAAAYVGMLIERQEGVGLKAKLKNFFADLHL